MSPERVEALSFALDGEWYCVDVDRVANVLRDLDVTRVDAGPAYVHGTATTDDEALLVIDVARLFGTSPPTDAERDLSGCDFLVFDSRTGDQVDTWAVDEAGETVSFEVADVVEPSTSASLVHGLVTVDGRPLTWVDAAGINP